ncbi:MAG: caspase family protein [Muribaculaceae bacterium]|nr:caspase family protein [Muribaculaceae bacterium]
MKRLILCLAAIIAISVLSMQARTYVLSVGVSKQGIEGVNDLGQTTKDAKSFKKLMESHSKDITLLTSKYATKNGILSSLKKIADTATANDRIYFYFSGHGGEGVICAYDDLVTYDEIVKALAPSKSPMIVCFIDACHSGSAVNGVGNAVAATGKKNIAFFTGCRPNEYSWENPFVGAGYFTQSILKGLRGKSDADGDKRITVKELFKYCYNDVVTRSKGEQHPQLIAPEKIQNAALIKWQ